jgi:fatty acid desaturase
VITGSSVARDCDAGLLEQVLLHSPMIMYHGTHHERPALPYRALRAAVRAQRRAGAAVVHGNGGLRLVRAVLRGLPA